MEVRPGEKIVLFGDSLGKGVTWNQQRGRYGRATVSAVQVVAERLGLHIENRSRFGATAPQGLELLERDLANGLKADAAVIEFGGNDSNYDWRRISEAPGERHEPATLPEGYMAAMGEMIHRLRERGIRPIVMTLPPINAERYFHFLVGDRLNPENILSWLGDVQHIYRHQEMYSALAVQVAAEQNAQLLDLRTECLAIPDFVTRLLCVDGLHLNDEGQRFAGKAVIDLVRRRLGAGNPSQ